MSDTPRTDAVCAPAYGIHEINKLIFHARQLEHEINQIKASIPCPRITATNSRAIANHFEKGEPFGGLTATALVIWLRSTAEMLESFHAVFELKLDSAPPEGVNLPTERQTGE